MADINHQQILEQLADAVIVTDRSGRVVYTNAACEQLLGWPVGTLHGQALTAIQPAHMRDRHKAGFERYWRTGESKILNQPIRVPAMRKDGTQIMVELTLSASRSQTNNELITGCLREQRDQIELERQRTARSRAETRARHAEFLDKAGRVLASALDYEETLTRIARLAVPEVADWCLVNLTDERGLLQRLAVTHSDPAKEAMALELEDRYPPTARAESSAMRVLRTGEAELVEEISDSQLADISQNQEHLELLHDLGLGSYVCVPITARQRTLGALTCVTAESSRHYGTEDLDMLEDLGRHAGQAIDNARLFGELEREITKRRQREARLARLSRLFAVQAEMIEAIVRAPGRPQLFSAICRIAVESGGFQLSWVGLIDDTGKRISPVAHRGAGAERYLANPELTLKPGSNTPDPVIRAVQSGEPAVCNDIASEPHTQTWREHALAHGYRALAALPLHIQGNAVGAFTVYTHETEVFNGEEIRLLVNLGHDISFALESLDRERRRREAEQALQDERTFLRIVLQHLKDGIVVCDARGNITLFNSAAQELHGLPPQTTLPGNWRELFQLLQPDGITPLDRAQIPLYRALAGETLHEVEMVIAPNNGDRRVVVCNGQPLYDNAALKLGALMTLHDITARKQAETRLVRQAFHDPLTGLPNRRLLLDRLGHALARAKRQPATVAVLFIDLDRLKVVNDSLGHKIGDQALIMIAGRLREIMRAADTVARLGGDEFVVVCEDLDGEQEAIKLSDRIAATIAAPCRFDDLEAEVVLTASIGIAVARGEEAAEDLLLNADTAMYQAKQHGKARHVLFDDALRTQAVQRLTAENALRSAIADDRLRLVYQPIVDLKNARFIGAEALIRYQDRERGLVMPNEFLDIAEESGLIVSMGNWVLAQACQQAQRWRRSAPNFQIAVNLSTRQLSDPMFMQTLNDILVRYDLPSGAVELEITESVLMEAANSTQRILQQLKDAGPRLGIDDFGTGYSSLTYLRRFPFDFIKIDRSFVSGLGQDDEDTAIVEAVINLGKALRLTTVAEGVETLQQASLLRHLECDFAQGFYFARPQSADTISQWMHTPPAWQLDANVP